MPQDPLIFTFQSLKHMTMLGLYVGNGVQNSSLLACPTSTIPTELPLSPVFILRQSLTRWPKVPSYLGSYFSVSIGGIINIDYFQLPCPNRSTGCLSAGMEVSVWSLSCTPSLYILKKMLNLNLLKICQDQDSLTQSTLFMTTS